MKRIMQVEIKTAAEWPVLGGEYDDDSLHAVITNPRTGEFLVVIPVDERWLAE